MAMSLKAIGLFIVKNLMKVIAFVHSPMIFNSDYSKNIQDRGAEEYLSSTEKHITKHSIPGSLLIGKESMKMKRSSVR